MKQDFHLIKENIENFVSADFTPVLKDKVKDQIEFVKSFQSKLIKLLEQRKLHAEKITDYNEQTFHLIEKSYRDNKAESFGQNFSGLSENIDNYINSLDELLVEEQSDDRFSQLEKDSFTIKASKRTKKFFLIVSHVPISTGNLFRKIFKKELKEKKNWNHSIPYKNVSLIILRDKLYSSLFPLVEEINLTIASSSLEVLRIDEKINEIFIENSAPELEDTQFYLDEFNNILNGLENKLELTDKKLPEIIEFLFNEFETAFEKAGTIELPLRNFSSKKVSASNKKLNDNYRIINEGWQNSFFSLFEDWRFNKELYILRGKAFQAYSRIKSETEEKIDNIILPEINGISSFLEDVKYQINDFYGNSGELLSLFYRQKDKIYRKLSGKIIPVVSEIILKQNIPEVIDGIELKIERLVQDVSNKRAVVKTDSFLRKIRTFEIDYISPKEIISFASLNKFSRSIQHVKSGILKEIQKVQDLITDIDQISDFNLETAISMFRSSERTGEDPLDIASEGIERAISKSIEIKNLLLSIKNEIDENVRNAVNAFNGDLIRLTKLENIFDIKIKIAKAKALQRTARLKESSVIWIKRVIPFLKTSYEKEHGRYVSLYSFFRKRLGLIPKAAAISSEISDFLAATQTAVSKLPVVYRRLFEIEALTDERFFEGRDTELAKLNSAYEHWKRGGYAPAALVGEKGSGATTLLNFFEIRLEKKFKIIRTEITNAVYSPDNLKEFFIKFLDLNAEKNIDEIIDHLNSLPSKQVIVIENIQHLFLRLVSGFQCLKILFEVISKTQKNIFWIATSSLYSWEYLNKTINIGDYFGYIVRLESMDDEQMVKVILKRHKISGYNLNFKPSREEENSKSYLKNPEEKKQDYLKKQYFSDLNKFAKSNISLALLFWLRSTKEVTGDTITIGSLRDIDFSFFASLEISKVFTLHALLIHDGLTIESFSLLNNLPEVQSRLKLLVLQDDGIITKRNGLYKINPLLYRQTVTLLQTKNIIH